MKYAWDQLKEPNTGYMDLFGESHYLKEPISLKMGRASYFRALDYEDADKWRKAMQLQRRAACPTPPYGPH